MEDQGATDAIQVAALVQEFFSNQSLKILPQEPFGDAVGQFVSKDDKHAMEVFVIDALSTQVNELLALDTDEKDIAGAMEELKTLAEQRYRAGFAKNRQLKTRRRMREKPEEWDSDLEGHWTAQPDVLETVEAEGPGEEPLEKGQNYPQGVSRAVRATPFSDDEDVFMEDTEPAKKGPASKRVAAAKTTRAAAAKKPASRAAPTKKAPARGRKKTTNPFMDSDEEDDVIMDDDEDEEEEEPVKPAPKRTAPTRAAPRRAAQPKAKATNTRATKSKQTTLNFTQSQRPGDATKGGTQNTALEISDDEIEEDDDAFESMPQPPTTRSRRR